MTLEIVQIEVGHMANFSYLVADREDGQAVIIDPSWELEKIFSILNKNNWTAKFIINTHTHFDHTLGNEQIAAVTASKVIQHRNSNLSNDISVSEGDTIRLGKVVFRILHTPGHSKDSMCVVVNEKFVFTGDTLFVGNCGRTDLPGGDAGEMYDSLYNKIINLDDCMTVYPGHNYGNSCSSTIRKEKKTNHVLQQRSKQEFVNLMTSTI